MADNEPNEATQDEEEDTSTQEQDEVTPKSGEMVHEGNDDASDDDDEDPVEAAAAARAQQLINEALRKREEEEAVRRAEEAAAVQLAQLEEEKKKKLNESFTNTVKKTRDALAKLPLRDEDGNPLKLTDDMIQEIVEPWREQNGFVQQQIDGTAQSKVYSDLAQAVISLIPADKQQEFAKKAGGKPLTEYLKTFAELHAPNSDFAKKLTEDTDVKTKAAFARGFTKGQKAPVGTPSTPQQGRASSSSKPDLTSVAGAARALHRGEIDEAKFLEVLRSRQS